jgi:hypothetical protein
MKKLVAGGVLAAVALAASSYFSPYLTLYQMREAIKNKNADAFAEHVDFPALRESFKGQMLAVIQKDTDKLQKNRLAAFGAGLATMFVGQMVDAMISPAGVIAMMKTGEVNPAAAKQAAADPESNKQKLDYRVSYKGWGHTLVQVARPEKEAMGFILRRDGLWSWKLAAVEFPETAFKTN